VSVGALGIVAVFLLGVVVGLSASWLRAVVRRPPRTSAPLTIPWAGLSRAMLPGKKNGKPSAPHAPVIAQAREHSRAMEARRAR